MSRSTGFDWGKRRAATRAIRRLPAAITTAAASTDNVELIVAPAVRVEDLFVRPDPQTGIIRVQANLRNAGNQSAKSQLLFTRYARHER